MLGSTLTIGEIPVAGLVRQHGCTISRSRLFHEAPIEEEPIKLRFTAGP